MEAYLYEDMWKASTEVSSVNVELFLSRNVDVLTSMAVDLHPRGGEFLRDSNGENVLALAENTRAISEGAHHVLLLHHS